MRWLALLFAVLIAPAHAQTGIVPAPDMTAYAKKSDMPVPADTVPPPVADSGAVGAQTAKYALQDHTHVSSVQKTVLTTDANGQVDWTFPRPFAAAPVIQVTVETTSGQPYLALITAKSATAVSIKVLRAQTLPASLTLLSALVSFNIFGGAVPAGVSVHIYAAKATT